MKKLVLIRLDKIGDLISTLPVDQVSYLKDFEVTWVISKGLDFLPTYAEPPRKFIALDKNKAFESFKTLLGFLKKEKPEAAVSFQAPWWVSLALWLAGVPLRSGVRSQWHSFLFLNKSLRQKRSQAHQHEADYNADLLSFAFGASEKAPPLRLKSPGPIDLQRWGLEKKNFVIVHPGMAGSALNWPVEKYIELIQKLVLRHKVVLTGTAADEKWLGEIKTQMAGHPQVVNLQSQLTATELLSLIEAALGVVAPSTGVAHLAAALHTPVVTLFSPIRVQHPIRWAPRGPNVEILLPRVSCPAAFNCQGETCKDFFCMNQISVESVFEKTQAWRP